MALLARRDDKPISEMTDKELKKQLAGTEKIIGNLPPPTASAAEREKALDRARAAAAELPALRAEMKTRERFARHREIETEVARGGIERGRELLTPATIERFQRISQGTGLKLDAKRLDSDERNMVVRLWPRLREGEGSAEDRTAVEALVEKAAGQEPGFFDARRKEIQMKKQVAEAKEELHLARLPRRARLEEPGTVTLPRVVFSWLQQGKGQWTVADVGTLSVILSMFEEKRSLVDGADFEQGEDGESVLVTSGPLVKLAFERRINPHISYSVGSTGWVDLGASLKPTAGSPFVNRPGAASKSVSVSEPGS